jgi:hypothetical protein
MKAYIGGIAALAAACAAPAAAVYLPVGVQTNVAMATVTGGGWTQCYAGSYALSGETLRSILDGCPGDRLMLAGGLTGGDTLMLLAEADRADVLFDVGQAQDGKHVANGVSWYYNDSYSWGFAAADQAVYRDSCDASGVFNDDTAGMQFRLCWHTHNGLLYTGWRAGADVWLNDDTAHMRYIFTNSSAVPEPSTWCLMFGGFAAMGAIARRRQIA